MLRSLLPRATLAVLFIAASMFAWFESVYLSDQSRQIGDGSIALWMWLFRIAAAVSILAACALLFAISRVLSRS